MSATEFQTLGTTGTRTGMGFKQVQAYRTFMTHNPYFVTVAHGACQGADAMVHYTSLIEFHKAIAVHPPSNQKFMSMNLIRSVDVMWFDPKPYAERNQDIVDSADQLVAFPQFPEWDDASRRSGTWQTVRMARNKGIEIVQIYPSGKIVLDEVSQWSRL